MAHAYHDERIARLLKATTAQLNLLIQLKAGQDRSGGTAGEAAEKKGWVTPVPRKLTPEGEQIVIHARRYGY